MASKNVIEFRIRRKKCTVEAFGGSCGICGYSVCIKALHFHHINPSVKDFSISSSTKNLEEYIAEIKKCVCLCANCHTEIHAGITALPSDILRFDEKKFRSLFLPPTHPCLNCQKQITLNKKFCSLQCANKGKEVTSWPPLEELKDLVSEYGYREVGRLLQVSDNAVRKRLKSKSMIG